MQLTVIAATLCLLAAASGASPKPGPVQPRRFVGTQGRQFVDAAGRPLLLHGMAVVNKSKSQGYTDGIERQDMARIRSWGMNCIRLAIFWDGIEPEPGRIDRAYLDRVARIVAWARAERLLVLLDMHQDLYSTKYSDGAPAWATLDGGRPHTTGAVWSDSYYASAAVQSALDHFWANSPAPDGKPLQDHYALAWRAVAERFRNEPAVIGYDLMNEPFPGTEAAGILGACMSRLCALLTAKLGANAPGLEQLLGMESTAEGRRQITLWLADPALYAGMVDAATRTASEFETGKLMPLYRRLRTAIRSVDRNHILFIEPAMSSNMGTRSAITPLVDQSGKRDALQAYAPHGYDIVVDTGSQDLNDRGHIRLIFQRHGETARRLAMPMVVGEWGAFHPDNTAGPIAAYTVGEFDRLGCGDLYWAYRRDLVGSPLLPALGRVGAGSSTRK